MTVNHRAPSDLTAHRKATDRLLETEGEGLKSAAKQVVFAKADELGAKAVEKAGSLGSENAAMFLQYTAAEDQFLGESLNQYPMQHLRLTPQQHYERRMRQARTSPLVLQSPEVLPTQPQADACTDGFCPIA